MRREGKTKIGPAYAPFVKDIPDEQSENSGAKGPRQAAAAPRPLPGEPVLLFESEPGSAMIVADLHIGIEHELRKSGMAIFSQTARTLEHLETLIRENGIDHLVINGDLKHNVPSSPWEVRRREASQVLDGLGNKIDELTRKKEELESLAVDERSGSNGSGKSFEAELRRVERRLSYYRFKFVRERNEKLEYSPQENEEIPWVLDKLAGLVKRIDIVKGNHDGALEHYLPRSSGRKEIYPETGENGDVPKLPGGLERANCPIQIHPPRGVVFGDVGIFHGHTWPSPEVMASSHVIVAHNHPSVVLTDEVGARMREACWLRLGFLPATTERYPGMRKDSEMIIMPAFDRFKKGIPVNTRRSKLLGPVLKPEFVDIAGARVYLLDGLYMGTVEALRPLAFGKFR